MLLAPEVWVGVAAAVAVVVTVVGVATAAVVAVVVAVLAIPAEAGGLSVTSAEPFDCMKKTSIQIRFIRS